MRSNRASSKDSPYSDRAINILAVFGGGRLVWVSLVQVALAASKKEESQCRGVVGGVWSGRVVSGEAGLGLVAEAPGTEVSTKLSTILPGGQRADLAGPCRYLGTGTSLDTPHYFRELVPGKQSAHQSSRPLCAFWAESCRDLAL